MHDSIGIYPEFIEGHGILILPTTRNMACCAVAGQGAGIAAALSAKDGVGLDVVSMPALQKELARQGVRYL